MSKNFWIILIALVIGLGVIFHFTSKSSNSGNTNAGSGGTHHVEGNGSTGVVLVEYGDYQCPYCGQYYPYVTQAVQNFNSQITYQFKNLPLTQLHPNAFAAARAAEAAGLMGKYWEMHNLLYEENIQHYNNEKAPSWISASDPQPYFDAFAKSLGLNVTKFNNYYNGSEVNNLINGDMNDFNATGAQEATPTFFLDGKQIQPQPSVASFTSFIQAAINQKEGKKSTTPTSSSNGNQSVQTKSNTTSK